MNLVMADERSSVSSLESSGDSSVSDVCLQELLDLFVKNTYRAKTLDRRYEIIHKRCIHLFGRDYKLDILDNKQGQLCGHYPSELIVIEGHLCTSHPSKHHAVKTINSVKKLKELITTARLARCRSRFVIPVILFENKNICRSSTLSTMAELYGRSGVEWIFTGGGNGGAATSEQVPSTGGPGVEGERSRSTSEPVSTGGTESSDSEWVLLNKVRGQDVQLMKTLDISLICDLMVEKKKLKYGVYVASSEKVDKWARYSDFLIASMPYPGCEFFKDYKDNGYNPVCLNFDWKQTFIDAELTVPRPMEGAVSVPYNTYQSWDLVEITQNYFQMLMKHLLECDGGMLIHCISGWDRTPLFISLIRLSLWADGRIHQSLCAAEILYLTLAYDWLLCGHQMKERHEKGEEVMYFCFDFLKYIVSDEYSVNGKPRRSRAASRSRNSCTAALLTHSGEENDAAAGTRLLSPLAFTLDSSSVDGELTLSSSQEANHSPLSSLNKVSLDCTNQRCAYSSSPVPPEDKPRLPREGVSVRSRRLNEVRELFIVAYRATVPETPEQPAGALAGFTGFLSKLAGSFSNGQSV